VLVHAASQYSRDYVFTCHLLEQVALEETRQKMLVLTEAGQSVYEGVEIPG